MKRRDRDINIFTMSALDLFASALGAFILLTIVIFPYFPNVSRVETVSRPEPQPVVEELRRRLVEAEAELARAGAEAEQLEELRRRLAEAEQTPGTQFPHLDLVVGLDVTGSMRTQIADLKTELDQLIRLLRSLTPSLGMGFVAFGDRNYVRPVTTFGLREISSSPADEEQFREFVNGVELRMGNGGGSNPDVPEAFLEAITTASRMSWRAEAEQKVIVMITDAPAYSEESDAAVAEAGSFAARGEGYRISTVIVGTHGPTEAFLGRVAAAGGGQHVRSRGSFTATLLMSLM